MEIVFARRARREVLEIDGWWRANRTAAPRIFLTVLDAALRLLATAPFAGRRAEGECRKDTRVLLPRRTVAVWAWAPVRRAVMHAAIAPLIGMCAALAAGCEAICLPGSGEAIERELQQLEAEVRAGPESDCSVADECAVVAILGVVAFGVRAEACADAAARVNEIIDAHGGWDCLSTRSVLGGPFVAACPNGKCIARDTTFVPVDGEGEGDGEVESNTGCSLGAR